MGHSVSGAGVAAPSGQGVSLSAGGNVLIARGSWGRRVGECGVGGGWRRVRHRTRTPFSADQWSRTGTKSLRLGIPARDVGYILAS